MSWTDRLLALFGGGARLGDAFFEETADILVEGDFGALEAQKMSDRLRAECKKTRCDSPAAARAVLAGILKESLAAARPDPSLLDAAGAPKLDGGKLNVMLLLGVNGAGKTTTAAKLASYYALQGASKPTGDRPVLAALDTFRAAAIDQLKLHGEKLGCRVVAHKSGGDPAAVLFDAIKAASAGGGRGGLVVGDTAGRMHTKSALVEELKKIDRVVEKSGIPVSYAKYLTLDATTGRNAIAQTEIFHEAVRLDGVILTKADSSAKGGIVFSIAETFKLPVLWLCTGEKYENIEPFNADNFVEKFLGACPR
jgi:fused signal recognition particle receptor